MRTSGKSAAHERRDPMNETGENAALFYYPRRRSRDQIDRDVSQGRVYPLADVLFKFLFGRPERAELFLDLLNALMFPNGERAFTQVAFIDRERSPARASGKGSRLDIAARLDGEMVNLEVQVRHEPGYLKRTLYYWSLLYSTFLERRGKYIDTLRTISLGLLDFELLPEERECRNSYSIRNDASGRLLCDDLQIIYFELPKARRERKAGCRPRNRLERWLCYLDGMRGDEMERIAALEPGIGTALDLEREFFQNRDQRLAYIVDMMEFWDEEDISGRREEAALAKGRAEGEAKGRAEGEAKGRAEGEAKGRAEGRAEAARNLQRMGLELSKISEATGLSLDEIEALK